MYAAVRKADVSLSLSPSFCLHARHTCGSSAAMVRQWGKATLDRNSKVAGGCSFKISRKSKLSGSRVKSCSTETFTQYESSMCMYEYESWVKVFVRISVAKFYQMTAADLAQRFFRFLPPDRNMLLRSFNLTPRSHAPPAQLHIDLPSLTPTPPPHPHPSLKFSHNHGQSCNHQAWQSKRKRAAKM